MRGNSLLSSQLLLLWLSETDVVCSSVVSENRTVDPEITIGDIFTLQGIDKIGLLLKIHSCC